MSGLWSTIRQRYTLIQPEYNCSPFKAHHSRLILLYDKFALCIDACKYFLINFVQYNVYEVTYWGVLCGKMLYDIVYKWMLVYDEIYIKAIY